MNSRNYTHRAGLRTWWALGHCRQWAPPPFPAEVHHQTATFVGAKLPGIVLVTSLVVKTSSGKTKTKTKTGPCETKTKTKTSAGKTKTKTKTGPCETKTSVGETKTETKTRTITSPHQL